LSVIVRADEAHSLMLDAFDFDAAVVAPFRMQPGLRRLASGVAQLTPLAAGSRHQREKLAVLFARREEALLCQAGFDPAPALSALCEHAAREHPDHFAWVDGAAICPRLGVKLDAHAEVSALGPGGFGLGDELPRCVASLPADWRLAGLLALCFAEDFAIIDGDSATVPWLSVALPSRWAPREKIGRHFAQIHDPVADNATLIKAGEHLMRLVCGTERWERFVWNVTDQPRLNLHPDCSDPLSWAEIAGHRDIEASAWFRGERQTFIPLPELRQAVFTIAVDVVPLSEALQGNAARAQRLHDAIASMSDAVLSYRRLERVREPLLAWLAQRTDS
jgi:dimethylamine monooxygenase subunit A